MSKKQRSKVAKAFSIIGTVLTVLIFALALVVVINIIVSRAQNKPVSFFGRSYAIVVTNSMEPEIMTGDMIVFELCDFNDISVGDNIVFKAGPNHKLKGQNIVHKVVDIKDGEITTKGVHNTSEDKDKVTRDNFVGKCIYNSAGWGKVFTFVANYGIILLVVILVVPFAITQIVKIIRLSKAKSKENPPGGETNSEEENTENNGAP